MTDVSSNDSGSNYYCSQCGSTSSPDEVATLRSQLAEEQEANRMLAARCDELAGACPVCKGTRDERECGWITNSSGICEAYDD